MVNIQEDPYGKSDADTATESTETFPIIRLATIEEEDEVMSGPEGDIEDSLPGSTAEDMFENYKLIFSDAASSIYSEDHAPLLSDAVSRIYTGGAEELDVINVRRAILDHTAAENFLTNEQVAEIQDEMNLLRFSLVSVENLPMEAFGQEDNQLESSRHKIRPEANPSSYRLSHCSTPDTDDSNEILSRVSSYFTARTSPSLQEESEDVSTGRIRNTSIDEAEEASRKARSRLSSLSIQTSKSTPIELPEPAEAISHQVKAPENISSCNRATPLSSQLQFLLEKLLPIPGSFPIDETTVPNPIKTSEEINSSYSRSSASLSSLRDCSSTEELPSPTSFPTVQTTSLHELETIPKPSRRPFSLDEAIEIDNYCEKRKTGLNRGQQWMDKFWGFESLQMLFVWKYGWKPDVERFEAFWLRRQEQTDFWLLWDYPTNLV